MAKKAASKVLSVEGREVQITHPDKLYFSSQARISNSILYATICPLRRARSPESGIVRLFSSVSLTVPRQRPSIKSVRPASARLGCEQLHCRSLRAELRKRSSSMMRLGSPGSLI